MNKYLEKIAMRADVRHLLGPAAKNATATGKGVMRQGLNGAYSQLHTHMNGKDDLTLMKSLRKEVKGGLSKAKTPEDKKQLLDHHKYRLKFINRKPDDISRGSPLYPTHNAIGAFRKNPTNKL